MNLSMGKIGKPHKNPEIEVSYCGNLNSNRIFPSVAGIARPFDPTVAGSSRKGRSRALREELKGRAKFVGKQGRS